MGDFIEDLILAIIFVAFLATVGVVVYSFLMALTTTTG